MRQSHPAHRCAACDLDWPATPEYNLCPRCDRCTYASTSEVRPNIGLAAAEADRIRRIREFDEQCDAAHAAAHDSWAAEMNALLERTPSIPDPPGQAGLPRPKSNPNYGLGGPPRRKAELPSEDDIQNWGTPDA